MKADRRGFTLIELLVVIAIIGLLASVIISSLSSTRIKARDARRASDVRQLQNALDLNYVSSTTYPVLLSGLAPNFIASLPTDPAGGASYNYSAIGSGTVCSNYHLGAYMELGTTGALANDTDATSTNAGGLCTGSASDFQGTSAGTGTGASRACDNTSNTAAPAGNERCYDVKAY